MDSGFGLQNPENFLLSSRGCGALLWPPECARTPPSISREGPRPTCRQDARDGGVGLEGRAPLGRQWQRWEVPHGSFSWGASPGPLIGLWRPLGNWLESVRCSPHTQPWPQGSCFSSSKTPTPPLAFVYTALAAWDRTPGPTAAIASSHSPGMSHHQMALCPRAPETSCGQGPPPL